MRRNIEELKKEWAGLAPEELIKRALEVFGPRVALSSSLGPEDQVLTDMLVRHNKNARIFTLDTGRLFPETYSLIDTTRMHYGVQIDVFFPRHEGVQEMTTAHGVNLFYESIERRKMCCRTRKLEPLARAFTGLDAWICGLRREQSVTRTAAEAVEWDEANNIIKINPLIDWSEAQVWEYIRARNVPYNPLHDRGYPSIGCQPCTRAVEPGADPRSGRWWWESPEHRECGLHKR